VNHYEALGLHKTAGAGEIKSAYHRLARRYHPDRNPGDRNAEERFKLAAIAYGVLSDPEKRRIYDKTGRATLPVIPSRRGKYQIEELIASGDLADVYRATHLESGGVVALKIARSPAVGDILAAEAARLRLLIPPGSDPKKPGFRYLPAFLDSFVVDDGARRQVLVLAHLREYASVQQIRAMFPAGVDLEHGVWMFNRILEGLDYVHRRGQIHGALVPGNVLVWKDPVGHLCKLIDWGYGGAHGDKLRAISPSWRSFYPPEVLAKQGATASADIYMAAKLAMYLLGGREEHGWVPRGVPEYLSRFLSSCCLPDVARRPRDAWALHEEFAAYMKIHYGPKKFVPFKNPGWPG